jgi:hypothetical protein
MNRELREAYRDHLEDPYEPLLLQNYIRLFSRYKGGPDNREFFRHWKKWSGSNIVYDYVVYAESGRLGGLLLRGEDRRIFVGANLLTPDSWLMSPHMGDGYSGYYVPVPRFPMDPPTFKREDLKRNSWVNTQGSSYVLVNSETWPDDQVPGDVSDFFYSPYHGEVNLVSINGNGEIRWTVNPWQVTGSAWGTVVEGDLAAALEFGLVRLHGSDFVEVEVPAP